MTQQQIDTHPRAPLLNAAGNELHGLIREWIAKHSVTAAEYAHILSGLIHHQTFTAMAAEWAQALPVPAPAPTPEVAQ